MNGISRLQSVFRNAHDEGRKVVVPYVTAGDPDLQTTRSLLDAVAEGGADIIELGIPFSDPTADGPTLQRAALRALNGGFSFSAAMEMLADFTAKNDTPVILFGYSNPFYQFGYERLAKRMVDIGACGLLCVDLPPEEVTPLLTPLREHGLAFVPLLTPVSGPDRIELAKSTGDAFGYYVSVTGVTGSDLADRGPTAERISSVRTALDRPMVVGFGVRTPEDAQRLGQHADGIVVGSALVELAHTTPAPDKCAAVTRFVASLAH